MNHTQHKLTYMIIVCFITLTIPLIDISTTMSTITTTAFAQQAARVTPNSRVAALARELLLIKSVTPHDASPPGYNTQLFRKDRIYM